MGNDKIDTTHHHEGWGYRQPLRHLSAHIREVRQKCRPSSKSSRSMARVTSLVGWPALWLSNCSTARRSLLCVAGLEHLRRVLPCEAKVPRLPQKDDQIQPNPWRSFPFPCSLKNLLQDRPWHDSPQDRPWCRCYGET